MILIYFFVPETKLATTREDKKRTLNYISLEELNQIFTVKTRDCWKYYINHVLIRKVNNIMFVLRLRSEYLHIEDSMHFWSKDRLNRKRREEEAADSEKTAHDDELEEKQSAEVIHDEHPATSRDADAITPVPVPRKPVPLPRVEDTRGSIDWPPGRPPQNPTQPDPDSFRADRWDGPSHGIGCG